MTVANTLEQVAWLMDRSGEAALITDAAGIIQYVNPAFEHMTGFGSAEAIGSTPAILKSGLLPLEFYQRLWRTLLEGREFRGVLINRRKSGEIYHEEKTIRPLLGPDGGITHFLSCGHDVSERLAAIEKLRHDALHDDLTELPNRTLFADRLRHALSNARRTGACFAVAMVDVDRFKAINDLLGHAAGDAVLRAAALRLRLCVREIDTVARLGGDEFAVLLPGPADASAARQVLRKMVEAFAVPVRVENGAAIKLTISAGACLCPGDGKDAGALMRAADLAMYRAKHGGGNAFYMTDEGDAARGAARADAPAIRTYEGEDMLRTLERNVPVHRRAARAGHKVFRAGDRFCEIHVIRCGVCKLTKTTSDGGGQLVSLAFKGDWLGFDGIDGGVYGCDAEAVDAGEVWAIRYDELLLAGTRTPALLALLHAAMSREIARERDATLLHAAWSADAKVANFLHHLAHNLARSGLGTDPIRLPVSRAEIGSHLGLTHESVTRAISRMVREDVIRFGDGGRRELHVPALTALQEFARRCA
jgi:diguanylate cyclase (GGDEF)-like protein/PAS domain S-box-containing protein